jgi:hypothetical protein
MNNNIALNLHVLENSELFKVLNTITNKLLQNKNLLLDKNLLLYKKHATFINPHCNCWLNATLQMLGYIDDLVYQIINIQSTDLNTLNIKKLFTDLLNGEKFGDNIIKYGADFDKSYNSGYGNLYEFFYNQLKIGKSMPGRQEDASEGIIKIFEYFFSRLNLNPNSIKIINEQNIECIHNKYTSTKIEPSNMLVMPVPTTFISTNVMTFNKYLEKIISSEEFGENLENCSTADGFSSNGPYKMTIKNITNKYFIIHLSLFNNYGNKIFINMHIQQNIKINNLDYFLSGFIVHMGTTPKSGHYLFYKILPDGNGYEYNDSRLNEINKDRIKQLLTQNNNAETPYVLLYEKREFVGNLCKINYNILTDISLDEKLRCYSQEIIKSNIYEDFIGEFMFDNNILYYRLILTEQNKENLKLFIDIVCKNLFNFGKLYEINPQIDNYIFIKIFEFKQIEQQYKNFILENVNKLYKSDKNINNIENFKFITY